MSYTCAVSDQARAYAARRYGRPDWAKGTISRPDAAFLYDLVMEARPQALMEIGVASGVSTAFLSTLLSDRLRDSRLYAFDCETRLYDDRTKPVGAYLLELFEQPPANTSLFAGVSSFDIRRVHARPDQYDFVFLDADHKHPAPAMDVLSLIDIVKPGSWIALHDISLPLSDPTFRDFGPLYLFQRWPGEKRAPSDPDANIGAIRLFANIEDSAAALVDCCRLPWQHQPPLQAQAGSLEALFGLGRGHAEELRDIFAAPPVSRGPTLRDCELVIRGANPWSHFSPDLRSGPLILHANRRDEPTASISVRGLDARLCRGVVLPNIVRSSETGATLQLGMSLTAAGGSRQAEQCLELADDLPHFAYLTLPASFQQRFDAEFSVRLASDTDSLKGAWVKFKGIHFV